MPFRRYSRPRKFSRRPRRVIRRRPKVSKKIRAYVKKAIHRNIENKEIIVYAANTGLNAASSTTQSIGLIPATTNSTYANNRIGNQIKCVSGIIKGHVNLLPYNATTNPNPAPLWVKIMLVKLLPYQAQQANLGSTYLGGLFRGNAIGLPQQFNMLDMSLPINDDWFRLLGQKTFRLGSTSPSSTGPVSSGTYFDNSHMSVPFYFNWGKFVKSSLKYEDDQQSNLCQNHNLYLVFCAVNADGTSNVYTPCEYHYVNTMKFEDA